MVAAVRRVSGSIALAVVLLFVALLSAACTPAADQWPVAGPTPSIAVGRWTKLPAAPLSARHDAVGAWVGNRFLVVGGRTDQPCPANASCAGPSRPAERDGAAFDPAGGRWHPISSAPTPLSGRTVVVLADMMYVLVEATEQEPRAFVRYDPATDRWTRLPLPSAQWGSLVAGEAALFSVGGSDENEPAVDERFDPRTGRWHALAADPLGPSFAREATWVDGGLLLAAKDLVANPGAEKPALVRLAGWDPGTGRWSEPSATEIIGGGATTVGDLVVWPDTASADGGEINNWGRWYAAGGILTPSSSSGSWSALPSPPRADGLTASGLVVGSRIVVGPELDARRTRQGGHLLDPATGRWTELRPLPGPERSQQVTTAGEAIFVWGGATDTDNLADGYLWRV